MPQASKNPLQDAEQVVEQDRQEQIAGARGGQVSLFTCPDCSGTLWQVAESETLLFRCHVGHVLAAEKLLQTQADAAENALWYAIRTLTDRMVLGRQLAEVARNAGVETEAKRFEDLARRSERKAQDLRQIAESSEINST